MRRCVSGFRTRFCRILIRETHVFSLYSLFLYLYIAQSRLWYILVRDNASLGKGSAVLRDFEQIYNRVCENL